MPAALPIASSVRFHMSLNVRDLDNSVNFYRVLFGVEPAKRRADYAKFEVNDPPLVLSLEPSAHAGGGALNHAGFRMPDAKSLVAMQERLERAGISSQREEGIECCYARQTKFWVHDPDRTLWEVYTLDGDIEHRGSGQLPEKVMPASANGAAPPAPTMWEHQMMQPVPMKLPLGDGTADEVRLRGSFNAPMSDVDKKRLIHEAHRVLRPGGRIFVHVLTGDKPLDGPPHLPGPAAYVQHVPLQSEPVELLERAGFTAVRMVKFDAKPCFERRGVAMRELQLEGFKTSSANGADAFLLYKGPLRHVTDDAGNEYPRGQWVRVSAAIADRVVQGENAGQFVRVS